MAFLLKNRPFFPTHLLKIGLLLVIALILMTTLLPQRVRAQSDCPDGAIQMKIGDTVTGRISDTIYVVGYCFTGEEGDTVTITMTATSGDLDTYLALLDGPGDNVLLENNSGQRGSTDAAFSYTLDASGDYLIIATRDGINDGTTSGQFELTLNVEGQVPEATPVEAIEVELECPSTMETLAEGEPVEGTLSDDDWVATYCFIGREGDTVTIDVVRTSKNLDTFVVLTDADYNMLASNDNVDNVSFDSQIVYTLENSAVYLVNVSRYQGENGDTLGDYQVTLNVDSTSAEMDCSKSPVSDLLAGTWELKDNNNNVVDMIFSCDGNVVISINGSLSLATYTFVNDVLDIQMSGTSDFVLEKVDISNGILLGVNANNGKFFAMIDVSTADSSSPSGG